MIHAHKLYNAENVRSGAVVEKDEVRIIQYLLLNVIRNKIIKKENAETEQSNSNISTLKWNYV